MWPEIYIGLLAQILCQLLVYSGKSQLSNYVNAHCFQILIYTWLMSYHVKTTLCTTYVWHIMAALVYIHACLYTAHLFSLAVVTLVPSFSPSQSQLLMSAPPCLWADDYTTSIPPSILPHNTINPATTRFKLNKNQWTNLITVFCLIALEKIGKERLVQCQAMCTYQ